jgi:CubicO group peptidase (beta-lactamase class C family)
VASVTKSLVSALVGIAIDQGFIESVDQKVLPTFPNINRPLIEKYILDTVVK